MMMALGMFAFELDTLPYQTLNRSTSYRHAQSNRIGVGVRPASQYLGEGEDTLDISGDILPELAGDPTALDTVREMAALGEPWPLVDGQGGVHGSWVILRVDDNRSIFFQDGAARRYDFSISLHRVDDQAAAVEVPDLEPGAGLDL